MRGGDGWEAFEIEIERERERERECAVGFSRFVCFCIEVAAGARGPLLPLSEWTPRWPWCEAGRVWGAFLRESCSCFLPFVCSLWLSWVIRLLPSLLVGGWLPTPRQPRCNVTRRVDPFFRFVDLASIVHYV